MCRLRSGEPPGNQERARQRERDRETTGYEPLPEAQTVVA